MNLKFIFILFFENKNNFNVLIWMKKNKFGHFISSFLWQFQSSEHYRQGCLATLNFFLLNFVCQQTIKQHQSKK
jgi:hypothetical protein